VLHKKSRVVGKFQKPGHVYGGAYLRVGLAAANNSFAKLIRLAQQGQVITITRNGLAVAELRRLETQERRRGADPVQDLIDDIENMP
jgi:prevent-host-death family protein